MRDAVDTSVDRPLRVLATALVVALVCAALVSSAAVLLRSRIDANREAERRRHMLALIERLPGVERLFADGALPEVEAHVIELATGHVVESIDAATYDQRKAALDRDLSIELTEAQDIASIQRRAKYATVHVVRQDDRLRLVILPVHGSGYESRLYGFLALEADGNTIAALSFFEHAETPGLGGEVDSPAWRAKWRGKKVRDDTGRLRIGVAEERVAPGSPDAPYQVDAITGATVTSEGVSMLVRFWLGEDGFGPFLEALRRRGDI